MMPEVQPQKGKLYTFKVAYHVDHSCKAIACVRLSRVSDMRGARLGGKCAFHLQA